MKQPDWKDVLTKYWKSIAGLLAAITVLITFVQALRKDWPLGFVISGGVILGIISIVLGTEFWKKIFLVISIKWVPPYEKRRLLLSGLGLVVVGAILFYLFSNQTSRTYIVEAFIGTSTPPTLTPTPSATPTSTPTLIPKSPPSPTSTPELPPTQTSCPYQGRNDNETFVNLIQAEADAVNQESMEIINNIFAPDALIYDRMNNQSWLNPTKRYQDDLFLNANFLGVKHFGIARAGESGNGDIVWYTSGSSGTFYNKDGGPFSYTNGAKGDTTYGSDHWTFRRNASGCWGITQLEFNAGGVPFPP